MPKHGGCVRAAQPRLGVATAPPRFGPVLGPLQKVLHGHIRGQGAERQTRITHRGEGVIGGSSAAAARPDAGYS